MVSPLPAVFFLLLLGTASAGVLYSRNSDGSFRVVPNNDPPHLETKFRMGPSSAEIAQGKELLNEFHNQVRSISSTENQQNHIVNSPLGDEDLELVQEYLVDTKINKTGQLRYSSLATVEKALVKDIVKIILKDEEYKLLLNNPSFPDVVTMVKAMLRKPTQEVLQQQILNKVFAIQAYYNKYYKPLNNPETKEETLEFLEHLKNASDTEQLTVKDTVTLNEKMQHLAFLLQEKKFEKSLHNLEMTFEHGGSANNKRHTGNKFERKSAAANVATNSTATNAKVTTVSNVTKASNGTVETFEVTCYGPGEVFPPPAPYVRSTAAPKNSTIALTNSTTAPKNTTTVLKTSTVAPKNSTVSLRNTTTAPKNSTPKKRNFADPGSDY